MRGHTRNRYSPSIDNGYFHWKITELQLIWHRVCSKLELICSKFWFFSIQSVHLFRSDVMIPWFCGLWFGIFHIPYDFRLELQNLSYKSIICMQRRSIHEPYFFRILVNDWSFIELFSRCCWHRIVQSKAIDNGNSRDIQDLCIIQFCLVWNNGFIDAFWFQDQVNLTHILIFWSGSDHCDISVRSYRHSTICSKEAVKRKTAYQV